MVNFFLQVYERMNVADALQPKTYEDGVRIIGQVSDVSHACKKEYHVYFLTVSPDTSLPQRARYDYLFAKLNVISVHSYVYMCL